MRRPACLVLPLLLAAAIVASGCSSDDDDTDAKKSAPETSASEVGSTSTTSAAPSTPDTQPEGDVVPVPASIDATGEQDVSALLNEFLANVPEHSTVQFPEKGRYRVEDTVIVHDLSDVVIDGQESLFFATTTGTRNRAHWRIELGEDITVRNVEIRGANEDAGVEGEFDPQLEAQHGFDIQGTQHLTIDHVRVTDVWGDFLSIGLGRVGPADGTGPATDHPWARDVTVRASYFRGSGRQGITLDGADGVLIEENDISEVRRSTFDIEPTTPDYGATNVVIRDNTIGTGRLNFFSSGGAAGLVDDITISGNELHDKTLQIIVGAPEGSRRSRFTITDNTSDRPTNQAIIRLIRVDGVTITGNVQPMGGQLQGEAAVRLRESCDVVVTDNDFSDIPQMIDLTPDAPC